MRDIETRVQDGDRERLIKERERYEEIDRMGDREGERTITCYNAVIVLKSAARIMKVQSRLATVDTCFLLTLQAPPTLFTWWLF